MGIFAHAVYRTLVWRERQLARKQRAKMPAAEAEHLRTGARGETLTYWYLRQAGYTMVARNRSARSGKGELDLVGWDGPVLSFVEVKTRTTADAGPPELAVSKAKQKRIAKAASEYLRRVRRRPLSYRFDIASVEWNSATGFQVRLIKDAFKAL